MTPSKGSKTITDLTDAGDEFEDNDIARSAKGASKKRVKSHSKHKPTPITSAPPFVPKAQRHAALPTKRQNADGAKGGENKRHKRGVSQISPLKERHHSFCA